MKQLALLGLLISGICGCEDGNSRNVELGLPLTQGDMLKPATKPEATKPPASEVRPKPSETGPWPKAVADEVTFDFDRMQLETKLQHAFTIRNDGEGDLNLLAGEPTCKCTVFSLESSVLGPGKSTVLNIEWEGKFVDKNFRHGGPVFTDDPERPEIYFAVQGEVDAPFKVLPENNWRVGPFINNEAATVQAVICSSLFDEFEITKIESDSEYVSVTTEAMSSSELDQADAICGYLVNVAVAPEMPPGYMTETLRISIDKGEQFDMNIEILATREGPIRVVGADGGFWVASMNGLKLGNFQKNAGREAVLTLAVSSDEMPAPLEVLSSEVSPKFLDVSLEPTTSQAENVSRYLLKVRIPPGIPKTDKTASDPAKILLKTNHPAAPEFQFDVSFKAF